MLHKRYNMLLITLLFILVFGGIVTTQEQTIPQEKISLQYDWVKGKNYQYRMTQEMCIKMEMPGMPESQETITKQVFTLSQEVKDVNDQGLATIELKHESIQGEVDNPMMGKTSFDSTKEEDRKRVEIDPRLAIYALYLKMIGKPITMKMDPQGKIIEVKGLTEMMQDIIKESPAVEMFKDMFTDKYFKDMLQQCFVLLPEEPVAKGDSWENPFELPILSFGTCKGNVTSTYQGKQSILRSTTKDESVGQRECAKIDQTAIMTFSIAPNSPLGMMPDMKLEVDKSTGTIYFDLEEGIIVKSKVKIEMTGTITMTMPEMQDEETDEPVKMELQMKIEGIIRMELIE